MAEGGLVARIYAVILGPLALLTSLAHGTMHGGGTTSVLLTAWLCLLAFAAIGCAIGWIAERIVEESVQKRIEGELAAETTTDTDKSATRRIS